MEMLARQNDVVYRNYGTNRGLAKSWNEGIVQGYYERKADLVIVVNEDCVFGQGDLSRLAECAIQQRDKFIVSGRAYEHQRKKWISSEYGCFAVNPIALNRLGCFDENFFPVYCEDSDYRYRAKLAGLEPGYCNSTSIEHGGSSSLQEERVARQNQHTYSCNRSYYKNKWGGDCGEELFLWPFNDSRFSFYIDPRIREAPYLGFNRQDQGIVKF
jgi:GT2 family glycosyltransferase